MSANTEPISYLPATGNGKTRYHYCCVCSANSRIRKDLIFYGFPREGKYFVTVVDKNTGLAVKRDRPHAWADFAGVKIKDLRTSYKYICSLHFTPSDFFRTALSNRVLKKIAVPSLHPPGNPSQTRLKAHKRSYEQMECDMQGTSGIMPKKTTMENDTNNSHCDANHQEMLEIQFKDELLDGEEHNVRRTDSTASFEFISMPNTHPIEVKNEPQDYFTECENNSPSGCENNFPSGCLNTSEALQAKETVLLSDVGDKLSYNSVIPNTINFTLELEGESSLHGNVCEASASKQTLSQLYENIHLKNVLCIFCTGLITSIDDLIQHFTNIHPMDFKCKLCRLSIYNLEKLLLHLVFKHYEKNIGKLALIYTLHMFEITEEVKSIQKQLNFDPLRIMNSCLICNETLLNLSELWEHLNDHNYCTSCCISFKSETEFKIHKRKHDLGEIKFYKCKQCGIDFQNSRLLNRHAKNQHTIKSKFLFEKIAKKYLVNFISKDHCPYCGITIKIQHAMVHHISRHTLLKCDECDCNFFGLCESDFTLPTKCSLCEIHCEGTDPNLMELEVLKEYCPSGRKRRSKKNTDEATTEEANVTHNLTVQTIYAKNYEQIDLHVVTNKNVNNPSEVEGTQMTDIPCIFCSDFMGAALDIYKHINSEHRVCRICVITFNTKYGLEFHMMQHEHGLIANFKCTQCSKIITNCGEFKKHKAHKKYMKNSYIPVPLKAPNTDTNRLINNTQCPFCLTLITNLECDFLSHLSMKHKIFVCENCHVKFVEDKADQKQCKTCRAIQTTKINHDNFPLSCT